jgi:hypothetical protein
MASTTIPIVLKWMTLVNAFRNKNDAMSIKTRAQLRAARALLERGQLDEFHLSIVTDDSSPVDQCIDCSIFLSSSLVRAERGTTIKSHAVLLEAIGSRIRVESGGIEWPQL